MHDFIHYHCALLRASSNDFEKERYNTCAKEIVTEIFREKYNLPPFEAAVMMLHFGIEMLIVHETDELIRKGME